MLLDHLGGPNGAVRGTKPVLTPNPLAIGFPTGGDPILIDLSASITTTTMTRTLAAQGERYPEHGR